ncbi:MAG: polyphosphate kinase 1 [Bacteroidetes Order II. Incertae sedis bacterium]|nr:polyphosphate kinase 1 [Bacteroidetes Order II. bacterium]
MAQSKNLNAPVEENKAASDRISPGIDSVRPVVHLPVSLPKPVHARKAVSDVVRVPVAVRSRKVPVNAKIGHETLYFNRELSWLDFNWRVLAQAKDERWPLLERIRFLAIAHSNIDEFFRKRVGGLDSQVAANVGIRTPDGRTAGEQLALIRPVIQEMMRYLHDTWEKTLKPALRKKARVDICSYTDLTPAEKKEAHAFFEANLFPILTPLGVDPGHPFPFLSNLSLSLAVVLRHPIRGTEHFARLKVPTQRHPWVKVGKRERYVPVEQVIAHNLDETFRGMEVVSVSAFRVTRSADLSLNEDEADDLLEMVSEEVRKRRFAKIVRLEVDQTMPSHVLGMLKEELDLTDEEVYQVRGMMELNRCFMIAGLNLSGHQFTAWNSITPIRLLDLDPEEGRDIFSIIRERDLMLHHPYESFAMSTQKFIEIAAADPQVVAIKQTLYRTSEQSPIVKALMLAAEQGKEVAVLIEVKASLDEERNIAWANMMSRHGIHVTYGLVGLKTHAKVILVLRQEEKGLRTYCHLGTGNYNPSTAKIYTDVGVLTADREIGKDAINLFHYLTGFAPEQHYKKLIVAPKDLRNRFLEWIEAEMLSHKKHGNGLIMAKMNALDDIVVINKLYEASKAGVKIELIVRGHCRLRPGLKGFSENIRVISIIGRFLEHSRIYYFHNNGVPNLTISSADWQRRNLEDRVEVATPVEDEEIRDRLIRILKIALADNRLSWEMNENGQYLQRRPKNGENTCSFHDELMRRAEIRKKGHTGMPWDL